MKKAIDIFKKERAIRHEFVADAVRSAERAHQTTENALTNLYASLEDFKDAHSELEDAIKEAQKDPALADWSENLQDVEAEMSRPIRELEDVFNQLENMESMFKKIL